MSFKGQLSLFSDDWKANSGNTRGRLIVFLFRLAKLGWAFTGVRRLFSFPITLLYNLIVRYIMSVDLPLSVQIGGGLKIFHGAGIVVHPNVIIGKNCTLRHGVTLGERKTGSLAVPVVCDDVEFGCNSVVLGSVIIGSGALIGAGAVVLQSVPTDGVVVGPSAKLIKINIKDAMV